MLSSYITGYFNATNGISHAALLVGTCGDKCKEKAREISTV